MVRQLSWLLGLGIALKGLNRIIVLIVRLRNLDLIMGCEASSGLWFVNVINKKRHYRQALLKDSVRKFGSFYGFTKRDKDALTIEGREEFIDELAKEFLLHLIVILRRYWRKGAQWLCILLMRLLLWNQRFLCTRLNRIFWGILQSKV